MTYCQKKINDFPYFFARISIMQRKTQTKQRISLLSLLKKKKNKSPDFYDNLVEILDSIPTTFCHTIEH